MEYDELINTDPDDISDVLIKVERSFNIKFAENELQHITTFGELCDHIGNKIRLENVEDCTTQQAFYKLRTAFNTDIHPQTLLADILPKRSRISKWKSIERSLGIRISILRAYNYVTNTLLCLLLLSFIMLFINWPIGLAGILVCIGGFKLASMTGKELKFQTVGEVAEMMAREHYVRSRRNAGTANKKEVEKVLIDSFSKHLGLDRSN